MLALEDAKLEAGVTRSTWERNHITHVLHTSYVSNQAFKTKTETGMRNSTVATQIAIPPVIFFIQACRFNCANILRNARLVVVVPAPLDPVTAMTGCLADIVTP